MELRDYIEVGVNKAGSLTELGFKLSLAQSRMSRAKAHKEHLPLDACIKLADYICVDRLSVIYANELATEKKPEKREFWGHLLATPSFGCSTSNQRFTE